MDAGVFKEFGRRGDTLKQSWHQLALCAAGTAFTGLGAEIAFTVIQYDGVTPPAWGGGKYKILDVEPVVVGAASDRVQIAHRLLSRICGAQMLHILCHAHRFFFLTWLSPIGYSRLGQSAALKYNTICAIQHDLNLYLRATYTCRFDSG